jgi:hypothetical protein
VPEGGDDIPKMEEADPDHIVVEIGEATIESGDSGGGGVTVEIGPATIESGESGESGDSGGGVGVGIGPSGESGDSGGGVGAAGKTD